METINHKKIYLDNNATTMVDPQVAEAMKPFLVENFGNPNSLHCYGMDARAVLKEAMDQIYSGINASDDDDVLVVSCASEANNTVLKSVWFDTIRKGARTQIITTQIEHPAVLNTCKFLEEECGTEVVYLGVNSDGIVDVETLQKHLDPKKTALVAIMWANNETGLINPIHELCAAAHKAGALFFSDAVQAVGKVPVDVKAAGVDFLSFSAHKFHGPKGVGGLYIRDGVPFVPLIHGGEQMGGRRAGTLNVAGIVGMGLALKLADENLMYEETEVRRMRDELEEKLKTIPGSVVIGKRSLRTPNTILISFRGVEGEALLWDLNNAGIAASTGSACASESLEANPALKAMSVSDDLSHTALRISLSRFTTREETAKAFEVVKEAVARLRDISGTK